MTSFRPLKQNCPVCNGARTDCRENTKSGLIHCRYDDIGTQSGWRFVGADSIGFNMWAVDDGLARDSSLWESQRQQRAAQRERRLAATDERLAQSLSVDERDRNIRKIHAQIGLSSRHRQNLRDRGLTPAQIDAGKYFSIAPEQEVTGINPRLAGVDLWGSKLLIGQSGFACPVWDVQGRIIGWQTRFDDATNGKYKWATSRFCKRPNGGTAHLPNGELPLGCYRPLDGVKVTSIGLAEGFLKPYITAQKRGQVVIGAAGGNFASSPQQFKAYLDTLAAELDTKTVVLYPDSGAVPNNAVMRHYEQAIQMITEWGYTAQIAWWGQLTKEQPDIDELTSFEQIAYLTPEEFFKLGARSDAERHSFAGLFGIAPRLKRWFDRKRRSPWGFGCKDEVEVEPSSKTPKILEYGQKERIEQWENAIRQGVRYILDTSLPGTGKSHDTGLLTPLRFGVKQIIYATNQHRNPTTPTLDKDWQDLEARHKGLHRDEFGRLRRVNGQKPYSVSPNCGRNETISALRSKNIPGADTSDLLCMTCPQLELCRMGKAYGYLKQRASTLTQPRLRAHPDSLPDPIYQSDDKEFISYSERGLVIDEATEIIKVHRSVEIKASDISQTITALLSKQPLAFDALRPLLTTLHQHVDGEIKQPNIYGWSDAKIRQALPQVGEIDLEAIREALTSDPTPLIDETKSEHGVSAADLPRQARKMVTAADNFTAQKITNELALNWLPDFLDVLLGNQIGLLRIQHGVLTMTLSDDRLAKIAAAAKFVILLDATATASDIARRLKVDVKEILVMRQAKEDTSNLEVIQVQMGQRLGIGSRRQDKEGNDTFLQKRINALIDQISVDNPGSKVAVADFKRHTKPGDGKRHHWVDTRGVNDLEDYDVLIDVGIMCRTLADLEAEFTILYGRPPKSTLR